QKPRLVNGIPDYSVRAMAAQHRALAGYQRRLAAIDTSGWAIAQQVDYHLVRAEMNGLDFDHRVKRARAQRPSFSRSRSDQPVREGTHVEGMIELWTYPMPLAPERAAALTERFRAIPKVYEQ